MNHIYSTAAILLIFLAFLNGCTSGHYDIEKVYSPDSSYLSTGTKLKGIYKVRTAPRFTIMLNSNINLGMAELNSEYSNNFDAVQFINGESFGVKYGYGFAATGKISLHKKGILRMIISAGYNRFQSNLFKSASPYGNISYNVFAFGVGLENSFSPSLNLKPFIAAEIQGNVISGRSKINYVNVNITRNVKMNNSFRIGYAVYSGLEFMLSDKFGINAGLKLTNANQFLKKSVSGSNPNEITLRDKNADGNVYIEFAGLKNFAYTSFFAGINFYFGVRDIRFKF